MNSQGRTYSRDEQRGNSNPPSANIEQWGPNQPHEHARSVVQPYYALDLPPGWERRFDQWGREYFSNHYLKTTQWEVRVSFILAYFPFQLACRPLSLDDLSAITHISPYTSSFYTPILYILCVASPSTKFCSTSIWLGWLSSLSTTKHTIFRLYCTTSSSSSLPNSY